MYLFNIITFLATNNIIQILQARCMNIFDFKLSKVI